MQVILKVQTNSKQELVDITNDVSKALARSMKDEGIVSVYVRGATAAIMIQENWDNSVQNDTISLLNRIIPRGIWEHDEQDGNGDSHLKSGLVGPSEVIPFSESKLLLSTWQNIFLCEFDGPRAEREVVVTVL